jgi:hypothetical protein
MKKRNRERIALVIAAATLVSSCGKQRSAERGRPHAASNESIDRVIPSIRPAQLIRIESCPLLTPLWQTTKGSPAKPCDYPVGGIVSRAPSRELFVHSAGKANILRIIDPKTGEEIAQAMLPEAVSQTHRRLNGEPGMWGDFSYAICRDAGKMLLLVEATQTERRGASSGSGVGTALYGCTMDGTVLWTFLGKLTHDVCVVPVHGQSDLIVVKQGSDQIVLLSAAGNELARLLTPTFNDVEITVESNPEAIRLLLLADNIYCYTLNLTTLAKLRSSQSSPVGNDLKAEPYK